MEKVIVCDNPIMRCLATRRKDKMYALGSKVKLIASRGELKFRAWRGFDGMPFSVQLKHTTEMISHNKLITVMNQKKPRTLGALKQLILNINACSSIERRL